EAKRSKNLLKMKPFMTEEFRIIGFSEGQGSKKGIPVWKVQDLKNEEVTFDVQPKGSAEVTKNMWKCRHDIVKDAKLLTVKFQGKSLTGVPRFPIGIVI